MDQDVSKVKSLTINGRDFAKYLIEDNLLYIKVLINIFPNDPSQSEDYLIMLISLIEPVKFRGAAYLNI